MTTESRQTQPRVPAQASGQMSGQTSGQASGQQAAWTTGRTSGHASAHAPAQHTAHDPAAALSGGVAGPDALAPLVSTVLDALVKGAKTRGGPVAPGSPEEAAAAVAEAFYGSGATGEGATGLATTGRVGSGTTAATSPAAAFPAATSPAATGPAALDRLTELLAHGSADPADASCAAHLHCPPLAVAVAADLAVSALNPSQDSWDQAPAATVLETLLLQELAGLVGYDRDRAAGVLTSGGTESNLMGLMLARDRVLGAATGGPIELTGLRPTSGIRPRILASAVAHFSVQRAAALLGLGEDAVLSVPVDHQLRMDTDALAALLDGCAERGELPIAIVATAGTTDTGSIDPLRACAALAAEHGAWLHVDAAYGGGALLSDRLAPLLDGLALADSVSLDWHKLGWQPAAAGVFLVAESETYASLARRAVYLNPADDEEAGYPSLLGLSLRTTRRADAFKIAVTLRTLGREGLGRLVDACHELALAGARTVRSHPCLELHAEPVLTAFVFRYRPVDADEKHGDDEQRSDDINAALRRRLLREGRAVVGRTELPGEGPGRVRLKLTLLNPHTTAEEVERLLFEVVAAGRAEEEEAAAG
ncbi:pyridoxal phosphate-dependent decarboxylase family protein [Streptomyces sp. NBC_01429]|uniref:pyridoxal phosphate-dependent decarboxylase family protein n=1 Tax=Streptomyces sp. NBC_01429 TaxID=2903862 RepID=UPI002E28D47B|nr:pyridoxal-dependent decarboxylase [Streptomyces sp. NBC_01429]